MRACCVAEIACTCMCVSACVRQVLLQNISLVNGRGSAVARVPADSNGTVWVRQVQVAHAHANIQPPALRRKAAPPCMRPHMQGGGGIFMENNAELQMQGGSISQCAALDAPAGGYAVSHTTHAARTHKLTQASARTHMHARAHQHACMLVFVSPSPASQEGGGILMVAGSNAALARVSITENHAPVSLFKATNDACVIHACSCTIHGARSSRPQLDAWASAS